jgi:hypothetical protein
VTACVNANNQPIPNTNNQSETEWFTPPIGREAAASALGVSVRSLLDIRKRYERHHSIQAKRGRRVVFYKEHIEKMKELLKCEERSIAHRSPVGIPSGKMTLGSMTSASKVNASAGRRGSAIRKRLK